MTSTSVALPELLEDLFDAEELARLVRKMPDAAAIHNAIAWNGSHSSVCGQLAALLARRGQLDGAFKELLLHERPGRTADIQRALSQPGEPQRAAENIRAYYSFEQVKRRSSATYADLGAILVRESLDWATAREMIALPQVIERRHLMARDVFSAAEMAIVLLLRPPRLRLEDGRARLEVDLKAQSYGIYNNMGKKFLAEYYLNEETVEPLRALGREIHGALLSRRTCDVPLTTDIETIPYRWASGGVLPVVHWHGRWWCALFWRDIRPIGWNIANGASEDKDEYKDLDRLMWREAREELVILARDPRATRSTVHTRHLVPDTDVPPLGALLAQHHRLRAEHDKWRLAPPEDWNEARAVRTSSVPGPHSVRVQFHHSDGQVETREVRDVLLSINPLEFGIEVARVVHFELRDDDYMIDGEVIEAHGGGAHLIRRPVGLIDLATLHRIWCARGALGEEVEGEDFLEGRRVVGLKSEDVRIFDADIHARQAGPTPMMRRWNARYGRHFEQVLHGGAMPEMLQTLCPVTWRILELAFAHGMLDANGPNRRAADDERATAT